MKLSLSYRILPVLWIIMTLWGTASADFILPGDATGVLTRFTETPPPVSPVRPVAEFEPASHVLIRYPLGIPVSLVPQLANTAHVICIVTSSQQTAAYNAFNNAGTNMNNVSFLNAASDSYWTRDYGPWFIFDGNGDYGVVDWVYNRPRPNDNMIPQVFATQFGLNYYGMNLQQTGGNYMSDGIWTAAQTTLVYEENGNNQTNVNNKMHDYLGIGSYYVIPDPNNTYIDHIDCWAKILAPDKVLVRSVPTNHAQYNAIEAAANYFATRNCAWGYPWRVYRVNTPNNQPYTNSLILNKKVFVPIMNSTYDAAALQTYRDAMPGYEVIGVLGTSSAVWESTDALHCRTHEIPDQDMLHIAHIPLHGQLESASRIDLNARITAHSGQPLYSDSLFVSYRTSSGTWQRSYLVNITGSEYTTILSGFAPGDTIRYFIHAADQSGRSYDHPVFAALDPHIFVIQADTEAPVITHTPITTISNHSQPVSFVVQVTDNAGIGQVMINFWVDDEEPQQFPMDELGEGMYIFQLYPDFQPGDSYFYYSFEAYDTANPPNAGYLPAATEFWQIPIMPVANDDQFAPEVEGIRAVYPNPFRQGDNQGVTISCHTSKASLIELKIFNIKGQLVFEQNSISVGKGKHDITWNGRDRSGNISANGVYFIKIFDGVKTHKAKLLMVK